MGALVREWEVLTGPFGDADRNNEGSSTEASEGEGKEEEWMGQAWFGRRGSPVAPCLLSYLREEGKVTAEAMGCISGETAKEESSAE